MPWESDQQRKWGHTPAGIKALGGPEKVAEWDRATKGKSLPHRKEQAMARGGSVLKKAQAEEREEGDPIPRSLKAYRAHERAEGEPANYAHGGRVEGSAKDVREDKALAKKAGMTMKEWEASPQDVRHDQPMAKGERPRTAAYAAGGPVLGRSRDFFKPDGQADEFTGGRMPQKMSAPVKQDYEGKGAPAKRTGDKSLPTVRPRS